MDNCFQSEYNHGWLSGYMAHKLKCARNKRKLMSKLSVITVISWQKCGIASMCVKVTENSHIYTESPVGLRKHLPYIWEEVRWGCTHVPSTSLKSNIFLMSSTCFFHVSPLPVSPFSRAMALLYRPKSDRHWAVGGGRMRGIRGK